MKVIDLFEICDDTYADLKVLSAFNGKVLCHKFKPEKHIEIADRNVKSLWADLITYNSGCDYHKRVKPILCVFVDGKKEYDEWWESEKAKHNEL